MAVFEPEHVVCYKRVGDVKLHLHVFLPEKQQDLQSAVLFFFGGGWRRGAPTQFYPHCRHLASRGIVGISAEYRTEAEHGTSPFECVKDAKTAMRWLRANAAEFNICPERIAAGGGSAGGHLAAAAALVNGFNESPDEEHLDCRPDALILFNPVIDNSPNGYGFERIGDSWSLFSPMHNIGPDLPPPTLFMVGTEDTLIPVETARHWQELLQKTGAECRLCLYEGQPHGFFNYSDGKNEYYTRTVAEMDAFLESLGFYQ